MKNSHSYTPPHHSPSFLSDSPLNPEPPPETFSTPPSRFFFFEIDLTYLDDDLNTVQDLYDGLLHYVSCTTDDIVEVFSFIFHE